MFKRLVFVGAAWLVGCGGAPGEAPSPAEMTTVTPTTEAATDSGDAVDSAPSTIMATPDAAPGVEDDASDAGSLARTDAGTEVDAAVADSGFHPVGNEDAGQDAAKLVDAGSADVVTAKPVVRCKTSTDVYYCDDSYTGQGITAITFYPSTGPAVTCGGSHALTVGCTAGTSCTVLGGSYPSGTCE